MGETYPVVDRCLGGHPRLGDPGMMSGKYKRERWRSLSYWSGSLNPRIVDPGVNADAALKKAVRTVRG